MRCCSPPPPPLAPACSCALALCTRPARRLRTTPHDLRLPCLPRRHLSVLLDGGQRVPVQVADPRQIETLATGQRVAVAGSWWPAAPAAAAAAGGAAASRFPQTFAATSVTALEPAGAAPRLTRAPGGASAATAVGVPAAPLLSSLPLVEADMATVFIPSEQAAALKSQPCKA